MKNTKSLETNTHIFRLINYGEQFPDKWKGVMIVNKDNKEKDANYTNFEKVPTKVLSRKMKTKVKNVFSKYVDSGGFINKKDIDKLQRDLNDIKESDDIIDRIDLVFESFIKSKKIDEQLSLTDMSKLRDLIISNKRSSFIVINGESVQMMKNNRGTQFTYNKNSDDITKALVDISDDLGMPFDYNEIQGKGVFIVA